MEMAYLENGVRAVLDNVLLCPTSDIRWILDSLITKFTKTVWDKSTQAFFLELPILIKNLYLFFNISVTLNSANDIEEQIKRTGTFSFLLKHRSNEKGPFANDLIIGPRYHQRKLLPPHQFQRRHIFFLPPLTVPSLTPFAYAHPFDTHTTINYLCKYAKEIKIRSHYTKIFFSKSAFS
ncbi:hypothetical protein CEXT_467341 [Caerostris extrusa]|uniref:Uncharacterized protein n=1 Tax=Caerostris extrusa TaxID=172846 RepID=A0AAV4UWE8_CAEEX|nr:hypothetical protein CEXT_467341 [Caerostris extrusa]